MSFFFEENLLMCENKVVPLEVQLAVSQRLDLKGGSFIIKSLGTCFTIANYAKIFTL